MRILLTGLLMLMTSPLLAERSSLYPENWTPGYADAEGRYLHDFSYAGYRKSEVPIPQIKGPVTDVTKAPYAADPTGRADAREAIQRALDDVGRKGGGVVFLPAGTYRLTWPEGDAKFALRMQYDNVVLRGAGRDKSHLFLDETVSRLKTVLMVQPDKAAWWFPNKGGTAATADLPVPTRDVPVEDASPFKVGDLVTLKTDLTQDFIDQVGMTGKWTPKNNLKGVTFVRRVTAVDPAKNVVQLDTPTRYPMKTRDNLRLYKLSGNTLREVGLEDFSIGMKQSPKEGLGEEDHTKEGTAGYDVHASAAIQMHNCEDGWGRGIGTYRPEGNDEKIHIHSHGIRMHYSRQVTLTDCDFRHAQYHGGGGNGYLYTFSGNDCLVRDSHGENGRHNFDFQNMWCSGNVLTRCTTKDGSLPSDFHMYLSQANLLDDVTCDGDYLECRYRPYAGPMHGESGTHNVFWNTHGLRYAGPKRQFIVDSRQQGPGYVIGTRGPAAAVYKNTDDFVELVGRGDALVPQSLWEDQFRRRTKQSPAK
jgi:hypothetical protein